MKSFEFNHYDSGVHGHRDVSIKIEGDYSFDVMMQEFETFLNACGYHRTYPEVGEDHFAIPDSEDNMAYPYDREVEETTNGILSAYEAYFDLTKKTTGLTVKESIKEAIIPFLENLKKDPDKVLMRWPNRADVIDAKIKEIENIIGE